MSLHFTAEQHTNALRKTTRMLASEGVQVTTQGARAFIEWKPNGEIRRINLPNVPRDASPEFLAALQGFLDHEVGHALNTLPLVGRKLEDEAIKKHGLNREMVRSMANIIEDVRIEGCMEKQFPGSPKNLEAVRKFFVKDFTAKAIEEIKRAAPGKDEALRGVVIPVYFRARGGQVACRNFMDDHGLWPLMEGYDLALPDLAKQLAGLKSTADAVDLAIEVLLKTAPPTPPQSGDDGDKKDKQSGKPQNSDGKSDGKPQKSKGKQEKAEDKEPQEDKDAEDEPEGNDEDDCDAADEGNEQDEAGDADEDEDQGEGATSKDKDGEEEEPFDEEGDKGSSNEADDDGDGEADEPEENDDAQDEAEDASDDGDNKQDEEADEPQDGDDGDQGDDDADNDEGDADCDAGDEDDEKDADQDEGDEPEDEPADEPEDEPADEGNGGDEETEEAQDGEGAGQAQNEDQDDGGDHRIAEEEDEQPASPGVGFDASQCRDFDEVIAEVLEAIVGELSTDEPYHVFTRDNDKIEPAEAWEDAPVGPMEDRVNKTSGALRKNLERLIAARSLNVTVAGYRRGRVHPASLHRLQTNDDRVFSRKHEAQSKDTAVSLVVDCSGSMKGHATAGMTKMQVALDSAWVFAETLERIKVANEVVGFTTDGWEYTERLRNPAFMAEVQRYLSTMGCDVSHVRLEGLIMPIFKSFGEGFTQDVKRRLAGYDHWGRNEANVDGESIRVAASRLATRKERRKVMIVFSDGQPAGTCRFDFVRADLKRAVKEINDAGIETIGIGIADASVQHYYPKHFVINRVEDLTSTMMGQLKALLTS